MGVNNNNSNQTKADLLLSQVENLTQQNRTLDAKVEQLARQNQAVASQLAQQSGSVGASVGKIAQAGDELGRQVAAISAQSKSVQTKLEALAAQNKAIDAKVQEVIDSAVDRDMDREAIMLKMEADKKQLAGEIKVLSERLESLQSGAEDASAGCDIDELAAKVAEKISVPAGTVDYDLLAAKVAENLYIPSAVSQAIDYDALARKLSQGVPAEEVISADYIASKVAEQLMNPSLDEAAVAGMVAQRLGERLQVAIDGDEIADRIAKQVGTISPEQFDVMVDDDGCDSLARAVESKLNYEALASAVADKLTQAGLNAEVDSEEIARLVGEKLEVGQINEDTLAEKAAAVLSNYLPEVDSDEIAQKVVSAIPATDSSAIASSVAALLLADQADKDYDIVLDEEGIDKLCDAVAQKLTGELAEGSLKPAADRLEDKIDGIEQEVTKLKEDCRAAEYDEKFADIQRRLDEIKAMLVAGAVAAAASDELAPAEAEEEPAEEELVTVSEVMDEEHDGEEDAVIGEIVADIDENPAAGEIMPDGIPGISNSGVDFANMMKYNRSFIARIIQSTDEQKRYYGEVKNSLLAYKKVNSNIAWGAERFNKGRETIARFKIRGKTLCLYLALDPAEFPTSVYHHADVSDNKSMHGTPMMVKIKSPRGVKKAVRLVDIMLEKRGGIKREITPRDYAAMYPYETIEELIEEGLVKDVSKK